MFRERAATAAPDYSADTEIQGLLDELLSLFGDIRRQQEGLAESAGPPRLRSVSAIPDSPDDVSHSEDATGDQQADRLETSLNLYHTLTLDLGRLIVDRFPAIANSWASVPPKRLPPDVRIGIMQETERDTHALVVGNVAIVARVMDIPITEISAFDLDTIRAGQAGELAAAQASQSIIVISHALVDLDRESAKVFAREFLAPPDPPGPESPADGR